MRPPEWFISRPKNLLPGGIKLAEPHNIWGVPLPPDDWEETASYGGRLHQVAPETNCVMEYIRMSLSGAIL